MGKRKARASSSPSRSNDKPPEKPSKGSKGSEAQRANDHGQSSPAATTGATDTFFGPNGEDLRDLPVPHAREDGKAMASRVSLRLSREGRWTPEVQGLRTQLIKDAMKAGLSNASAKLWAYAELDRMYPPEPKPDPKCQNDTLNESQAGQEVTTPKSEQGTIKGLGAFPADWPELPGTASLKAELSWCQANRLLVISTEPSGASRVDLSKAQGPAPSMATLSWLETCIRSHAKYLDAVTKALTSASDEQASVRRERMAIDEIDALLAEMEAAEEG